MKMYNRTELPSYIFTGRKMPKCKKKNVKKNKIITHYVIKLWRTIKYNFRIIFNNIILINPALPMSNAL